LENSTALLARLAEFNTLMREYDQTYDYLLLVHRRYKRLNDASGPSTKV
jgi:hypothetical protein